MSYKGRYEGSVLRALKVSGGNRLPRTGLIFYAKAPGMVDSIGLSASALWAALPAEHRAIYFSDPSDDETMLDAETIITNIEASEYLNVDYLIGDPLIGYAQYADGTDRTILNMAVEWFYRHVLFIDNEPLLIDGLILEVV